MDSERRTTFLTGSTGFIGQYVLRGLLQRDERVVVMLRDPTAASTMRLAGIMAALGVDVERHMDEGRLMVAEGTLPGPVPQLRGVRVDQVIHSAACLQIENVEAGEPFATNFEGVKAIAEWADDHEVPHFHFVSTAYTCGRSATHVREVFHTPRPDFATDYELSKWLAEEYLLSWARRRGRRLTILRPSLVVGDSQTGYTTQYGGFYQLGHMIDVLQGLFGDRRRTGSLSLPIRIPADPQGRQNLVPVDYVARAILAIVSDPALFGSIYHVTNPDPPTNDQVKRWLEQYYRVSGGVFVEHLDPQVCGSTAERMFFEMSSLILQQFKFVPVFDCRNTLQALSKTTTTFPLLDRALVFRLLDYAQGQKWGRRAKAAAS